MKPVRISIKLLVLYILFPFNLFGADFDGIIYVRSINTITTAVPFLMIAPDARAGAMGDVGVSSSPDINSMHWNPAKYAFFKDDNFYEVDEETGDTLAIKDNLFSVGLNYTRSFGRDINLSQATSVWRPDQKQAIAISMKYFTLGEVNFTDNQGISLGSVKPREFAFDLAYARKLGDYISGAIAGRFIYSDISQGSIEGAQAGVAYAADLALYYQKPLNVGKTPATFSWGINISNIGTKITYTDDVDADFIPINLRIGPSINFMLNKDYQLAFMVDFNKLLVPTPPIYERDSLGNLIHDGDGFRIEKGRDPNRSVFSGMLGSFTDAPGGFSEEMNEITISVGAEFNYKQVLFFRGGYFHEHESKGNRKYVTAGFGGRYKIASLDFAYVIPVAQRSPLENVLRFSLGLKF